MAFIKHPVRNEITITNLVTAMEQPIEDGFFFKGESHDHWETVFVLSGEVGVSANDKIFKLSEGDIIFHKPWEFHKIWSESTYTSYVFIFSFTMEGVLSKKLENRVIKLTHSQQAIMKSLIQAFRSSDSPNDNSHELTRFPDYFNYWTCSPIAEQTAKNYAEILFLDIIQNQNKPKPIYQTRTSTIYHNIITYMEAHVSDWITVEEIAKACSYSPAYIKKVFSKYSDSGIHSYFLKLKLQKAILLFKDGKSIQQTSNLLSFSNTNYFGVVFKREFGMSPRNYIKEHIEKM